MSIKGYSHHFVSDKTNPEVIQSFTKNCSRETCRVSFRTLETTLMGCSDYYDKNGILQIDDRNDFTGTVCCKTCWRGAVVHSNGNVTDVFPPWETES